MIDVSFHKVEKVEAEKISRLPGGTYSRRIKATDETGRTVSLVLFSKERGGLKIEDGKAL